MDVVYRFTYAICSNQHDATGIKETLLIASMLLEKGNTRPVCMSYATNSARLIAVTLQSETYESESFNR